MSTQPIDKSKEKLQKSKDKFTQLAWLSASISLLIGSLSHVRSFPSYNFILSIVALYTTTTTKTTATASTSVRRENNNEEDVLLKSLTFFGILGALSMVMDILFCSIWAREILDGYHGVVKFALIAYIINLFVKAALLYYAMTVAVNVSNIDQEEPQTRNGHSGSDGGSGDGGRGGSRGGSRGGGRGGGGGGSASTGRADLAAGSDGVSEEEDHFIDRVVVDQASATPPSEKSNYSHNSNHNYNHEHNYNHKFNYYASDAVENTVQDARDVRDVRNAPCSEISFKSPGIPGLISPGYDPYGDASHR